MVRIQLEQQTKASEIMRNKFEYIFEKLRNEMDDINNNNNDEEKLKIYQKLKVRLEQYCDQLPVIGFNSQRYDLPLIKRYLLSTLERLDEIPGFVIRKENAYMALGTKYLDICNYLAAGTTLSAFYKAYNVTDPKGFFPYEWFDSLEKLDYQQLPPI